VALLTAGALCVACGSSKTSPTSTLSFVLVSPTSAMITVGRRTQMKAMAGFSDNSVSDVTTRATWETSDPAVVSILPTGYATSLASGTATVRATYQGMTGTLQLFIAPEYHEDCWAYDTSKLKVVHDAYGWSLSDDYILIATLASAADGDAALALARQFQSICWIGRGNRRADAWAYVADYWERPSGQPTTISPEDCVRYSPGNLRIVDLGALGWAVMDGSTQIRLLDNQVDAAAMLAVAQEYSSHCFIGRNNTQPTPSYYIVEYWK